MLAMNAMAGTFPTHVSVSMRTIVCAVEAHNVPKASHIQLQNKLWPKDLVRMGNALWWRHRK